MRTRKATGVVGALEYFGHKSIADWFVTSATNADLVVFWKYSSSLFAKVTEGDKAGKSNLFGEDGGDQKKCDSFKNPLLDLVFPQRWREGLRERNEKDLEKYESKKFWKLDFQKPSKQQRIL